MEHQLLARMRASVASGLQRKSVTSCSRWASKYRVMGKPYPGLYSFLHTPWTKEIHDADGNWCAKKAAQMGLTEAALNRALYKIDIEKTDVLYVLPSKTPDASDFSSARFDAAVELSPHLQSLFSDVKNVGHKRAGSVNLYIRGSRSRSGLKSLPAGVVIFDERDEMDQDNVVLALERTSGQEIKQIINLSTPTVENHGIDLEFQQSSQEHYFFRCPHCSRWIELVFPDSLVVTAEDINDQSIFQSHYICTVCKGILPHESKRVWLALDNSQWVAGYTNRALRGFYINRFYSVAPSGHPVELARAMILAKDNPAHEQELYNSKAGLAHTVKGARVTQAEIDACQGSYLSGEFNIPSSAIVTIGIDVGTWLHYEVNAYVPTYNDPDINTRMHQIQLEASKVRHFHELHNLIYKYRPHCVVIDANPERREALKFAYHFPGLIYLCFYGNNVAGRSILLQEDASEPRVTVDRSSWLDQSQTRFKNKTVTIPTNLDREYKEHINSVVRKYELDDIGNPVISYISTGPDHFAHAHNYAEIALAIGARRKTIENMTESPV